LLNNNVIAIRYEDSHVLESEGDRPSDPARFERVSERNPERVSERKKNNFAIHDSN